MKNSKLIFRGALAVIAIVSSIMGFANYETSTRCFLYYTNWSVWFASIAAIWALIETILCTKDAEREESRVMLLVKFCANIMIIATFIVAAFVLPDKIWTSGFWTVTSVFKHFLMPILTVVDSALFSPAKWMKAYHPFIGGIAPLIYWIIVIARACSYRSACGGAIPQEQWNSYYPYGFTNFDKGMSLGGLCGMLAGILVGLIIFGFVYFIINKKKAVK